MGRRRRLLPGDLASISVQSAGGMILVTLVATAFSVVVSLMLVIATAVSSQVYPVYGLPLGSRPCPDRRGRSSGRHVYRVERQPLASLERHRIGAGGVLRINLIPFHPFFWLPPTRTAHWPWFWQPAPRGTSPEKGIGLPFRSETSLAPTPAWPARVTIRSGIPHSRPRPSGYPTRQDRSCAHAASTRRRRDRC